VALGVLIAVILGSNRALCGRSRDALCAAAGRCAAWRRTGIPDGDRAARQASLAAGTVGPAIRLAARLMPPAAGRRWLAEADSFLFESDPA
jgi:hypothetical protein